MPDTHPTLAELAETALQVQDACNLSGVVHSWSKVVSALWDHAHAGTLEHNTGTVNTHPINVLFVDKLAQLAGHYIPYNERYSESYAACKELASKK